MPVDCSAFLPFRSMASNITNYSPLRIISHNTQGLNSPVKRRKTFQVYCAHHIDVVFLQETHFPLWYTPFFYTHTSLCFFWGGNAENKTNFTLRWNTETQREGFILVKDTIDDRLNTLISYYVSNRGQKQFFRQLFQILGPLMEGVIILGGDSNTAFYNSLDKSKPLRSQSIRRSKASVQIA